MSVLITGAGGGLGSKLADYLMADTDIVFCQYRNNSDKLYDVFKKHGRENEFSTYCMSAELTSEKDVGMMHDWISKTLGQRIHAVINLAGASTNGMSWKLPVDEFTKVVHDNLVSTFLVCKQFIPEMRVAETGRIINVSSVVASTGVVGASHYCAAKAGIEGFTRSLALELANKNITANTLALGYFDCGLIDAVPVGMQDDIKAKTPVKRFGTAEEIGGLIKLLLSKEGAFITGQTIHVNGGLCL